MHANKTRVLDLFQALDKNADVNMASDSGRRTGVEHGYALLGLDSLVAAAPTDAVAAPAANHGRARLPPLSPVCWRP